MTNLRFARYVVAVNCAVPLAMLCWDAIHRNLGIDPANYALHTTGLLTLIFLSLTLLVTPLRQMTGLNWLITFRRTLGLYAFLYGSVHFFLYFLRSRGRSVSDSLLEITRTPYLMLGLIAWLLMVPLAITSTNAMIKLLGPKRWQPLHRAVYAVAVLGVMHYFMQAKSDTRQPRAFIAVMALLLGYRLVRKAMAVSSPNRKARGAKA